MWCGNWIFKHLKELEFERLYCFSGLINSKLMEKIWLEMLYEGNFQYFNIEILSPTHKNNFDFVFTEKLHGGGGGAKINNKNG